MRNIEEATNQRSNEMLVLRRSTRAPYDEILIGENIRVVVLEIDDDEVRLGIDAPKDVQIHRKEVKMAIDRAGYNKFEKGRSRADS